MKHILLSAAIVLFISSVFAQSPLYIPYQAVARNSAGNLLVNQAVSLRFTVHQSTSGGTTQYQETQSATTNNLGLFSVNIGAGTVVSGTFNGITWSDGNAKFLQVEIDPTGGTSYTSMGSTQMMSVPYALYAGIATASTGSLTNGSGLTGGTYNGSGAVTWAVQALNGLNTNSTDNAVELGGSLTKNTTITQSTFSFTDNLTSTGDFTIQKNGSTALYILGNHGASTDGYVGIGTSGPEYKLHIINSSNTDGLALQNTSGGSGSTTNIYFGTYADLTQGVSHPGARLSAIDDGAYSANLSFLTKTPGADANSLTERLRINSNGNVEVDNLAGTGYRPVYADASGNLYTISGSSSNRHLYSYTGSSQTFTVPSGVNIIFVKLWGGGGGSGWSTGDGPGGGGGFVSGYLSVTPGATLTVIVGGGGQGGINGSSETSAAYGGGGPGWNYSAGGGGRSAIQITSGTDAVDAGGGGGGARSEYYFSGGGGGGLVGGTGGQGAYANYGGGGTQTTGGIITGGGTSCSTTTGTQYQGGTGCSGSYAGGGGGGWYGGAGAGNGGGNNGAGGGGSSYIGGLIQYLPIRNEQGATSSNQVTNNNYRPINQLPGGTDGSDYSTSIGYGAGTVTSGTTGANGGNGQVVIYW